MNKKFKSIVASGLAVLSISGVFSLPVGAMKEDYFNVKVMEQHLQKSQYLLDCKKDIFDIGTGILKLMQDVECYKIIPSERVMRSQQFSIELNGIIKANTFEEIEEILRGFNNNYQNIITRELEEIKSIKENSYNYKQKMGQLIKKAFIYCVFDRLVYLKSLAKELDGGSRSSPFGGCCLCAPKDVYVNTCRNEALVNAYYDFANLDCSSTFEDLNDLKDFCKAIQPITLKHIQTILECESCEEMQNTVLFKRIKAFLLISSFFVNNEEKINR